MTPTPDITRLRSLLERCEKAEGPNRELDAAIIFDLFATPVGQHKEDGGPIGYIRLDDQPSWNLGIRFPGKGREWFAATRKQIKGETLVIERDGANVLMNSIRIPELTSSVDEALDVVEKKLPGAEFEISTLYNIASVSLPMNFNDIPYVTAQRHDRSIPLALLSALLKALIAREEQRAGEEKEVAHD